MSRSFKKIQCHTLSPNFRQATRVVNVQLTDPVDDQVTIRVLYVGINASDINFTNGKYLKDARPPFDCGFEAVGTGIHFDHCFF
jgi:NADPH:quinone reductase-like Zn-dependent oxidoreductase